MLLVARPVSEMQVYNAWKCNLENLCDLKNSMIFVGEEKKKTTERQASREKLVWLKNQELLK